LRRHVDAVACLRVSSDPRFPLACAETPKTTDFNLIACAKRANNTVKDRLDNHFAILAGQFDQTRHLIDQIRFCHGLSPNLLQTIRARVQRGCPRVAWGIHSHNLLKFQGLLASAGFAGRETISTSSKTRPAGPSAFPSLVATEKRPRKADRAMTYVPPLDALRPVRH